MTAGRAAAGLALAAILGMPAGCGPRPDSARRFVLVTIDTLRADRLGCYGAAAGGTPTLDALAVHGVRFETAIAPAPLTLPSHASLLTALDPNRHGVHHNALFRLGEGPATLAERMREAGFTTAAFVSAFILDGRFGLARGFEHYNDRMGLEDHRVPSPASRRADEAVDAALAWLETAPDRFFLWLHLYDPHAPYTPPPPFDERFREDPYAGEIAFADAQLGRLLAALDARWPAGTLVAVTSDHGEGLGEHGEPTHSYGVYDATQRIPLLLRGPGLPAGSVVEELVRLEDLAPTLLELAGARPLEDATGRSLLPLVWRAPDEPRVAYLETLATHFDLALSPLWGVRTRDRKYVRAPRPELYDLAADPREERNLASADPEGAARLDRLLEAHLAGAAPIVPGLELDAGERARLESLGYVAPVRADAIEAPGRVGGVDPKDAGPLLAALDEASELMSEERFGEALERVEPLASRDREWVHALRAAAALGAGRPEVARESALALLAAAPSAESHALLGATFEAEGRLDEAEGSYREGLRRDPENGSAHAGLGRVAEARERRSEALERYRRAVEARVPSLEAVWRLAALLLEDGASAEAGVLLARLPPSVLRAEATAQRLALAELRGGRPAMGLVRAEAGLRERPDSIRLLQVRGALLEAQGSDAEALAVRERALALAPGDPELANDVAWSLSLLGREPGRALALARAASEQLPASSEALDTLAAVHLARGEPARALAAIERGLSSAQGVARTQLLLHRAEALARLGRGDEAQAALADALASRAPEELGPSLARLEQRVRAQVARAGSGS